MIAAGLLTTIVLLPTVLFTSLEGKISRKGSNINSRLFIESSGKDIAICDKSAVKVAKLISFQVNLMGKVLPIKDKFNQPCFSIDRVNLSKDPAGRTPLWGRLRLKDKSLYIENLDGSKVTVRDPNNKFSPYIDKMIFADVIPKYPNPSKQPYRILRVIDLDQSQVK